MARMNDITRAMRAGKNKKLHWRAVLHHDKSSLISLRDRFSEQVCGHPPYSVHLNDAVQPIDNGVARRLLLVPLPDIPVGHPAGKQSRTVGHVLQRDT
mmetsp:Transcript_34598/g.96576  ORF Transcript_34598/g.96576 Transcript_34598/m.96576 type:complete len:98 (+) Transcript_34598:166-459(+)